MSQKTVTVVALMVAKPDKIDQARTALAALLEPTRREPGCINYDMHQNLDDPARFIFYENWTTKADLEKHAQSDHLQALLQRSDELFIEPIDISLWEKV